MIRAYYHEHEDDEPTGDPEIDRRQERFGKYQGCDRHGCLCAVDAPTILLCEGCAADEGQALARDVDPTIPAWVREHLCCEICEEDEPGPPPPPPREYGEDDPSAEAFFRAMEGGTPCP